MYVFSSNIAIPRPTLIFLVSLNSRELIDQLSDIYFFDVLYILDHEPDNKTNHTEFIKEHVKFVEVCSISCFHPSIHF